MTNLTVSSHPFFVGRGMTIATFLVFFTRFGPLVAIDVSFLPRLAGACRRACSARETRAADRGG
jgi:hypothetical protein